MCWKGAGPIIIKDKLERQLYSIVGICAMNLCKSVYEVVAGNILNACMGLIMWLYDVQICAGDTGDL